MVPHWLIPPQNLVCRVHAQLGLFPLILLLYARHEVCALKSLLHLP